MFYLLTSNRSTRQNSSYTVGTELLKKVDYILNNQQSINIVCSNSNILPNSMYTNENKR